MGTCRRGYDVIVCHLDGKNSEESRLATQIAKSKYAAISGDCIWNCGLPGREANKDEGEGGREEGRRKGQTAVEKIRFADPSLDARSDRKLVPMLFRSERISGRFLAVRGKKRREDATARTNFRMLYQRLSDAPVAN